jgi:hypothetical protein
MHKAGWQTNWIDFSKVLRRVIQFSQALTRLIGKPAGVGVAGWQGLSVKRVTAPLPQGCGDHNGDGVRKHSRALNLTLQIQWRFLALYLKQKISRAFTLCQPVTALSAGRLVP